MQSYLRANPILGAKFYLKVTDRRGDHKKGHFPVTIADSFQIRSMVIDPLNPLMIQRKIIHLRWGWPLT